VLAQRLATPKTELDSEELMHLRHYGAWCKQRGVRAFPSRPSTVASFIRSESGFGVPNDKILAALRSIEKMHDQSNEPNPVACAAVRAELGRILDIKPPRSWKKEEHLVFNSLPIEARDVIKRHADLDSLALRRLQNRVAELAKKENCDAQTSRN
jgi:hypothetical protein